MVDRWVGRLLEKVELLGLADRTYVFFVSDHGFFFGEHGYFGKAEWFHDPDAKVTLETDVPSWLPESWLLTVGWSPLYQELTRVPLLVAGPGLAPRRIASYMPLTVTTRSRSLIVGGATEPPELYDLENDPREEANVWVTNAEEGVALCESAIAFLEQCGTAEKFLEPRRMALKAFLARA
jgi:hypothetical protein